MLKLYMCFFSMIRRKPTTRKLWDKTTDRWEHDMYREDEQGPKTKEELEVRSQIVKCILNPLFLKITVHK